MVVRVSNPLGGCRTTGLRRHSICSSPLPGSNCRTSRRAGRRLRWGEGHHAHHRWGARSAGVPCSAERQPGRGERPAEAGCGVGAQHTGDGCADERKGRRGCSRADNPHTFERLHPRRRLVPPTIRRTGEHEFPPGEPP